jgi:RNA polymerase sigma-70 factor (ECF subfamily)
MSDTERDRACVERLARGDTTALEELYDRHTDVLYSLAFRIVGRAAEAEEVVQEAWVQAWRSAPSYDPRRGAVGAWLVTLTRSRAIDRVRSEASRHRAEAAAGREPLPSPEDASAEAAHRERSARVAEALNALGSRHRRVLELAYFSGLSQTEIAERLKAPLGTVKSWTRQALTKLTELVPREENG